MAQESKLNIPRFTSYTNAWHSQAYNAISPKRTELSMAGRNVLVTGGGTGIGKAIAKAFAEAGATSVSILGRRESHLKETITEISTAVGDAKCLLSYERVDLGDSQATKDAIDALAQKLTRGIDILVCNAGGLVSPGPLLEGNPDRWMKAFEYNVLIPLNTIQAFTARAGHRARVINISSGIAHMSPVPGLSAHGASKAAGVKLMEYLQIESPHLHVVNVQPGSVDTEMSRKGGAPGRDAADLPGAFCVWLASPESSFLKGKFVWANRDVEELKQQADKIQGSRDLTMMLQGVLM